MDKQTLTCINCPMGCTLLVSRGPDGALQVEGNMCPAGLAYAKSEMTNPVRTVCSTVALKGADLPVLPCKTNKPVPKDKIFAVMEEINHLLASPPIRVGSVLLADIAGTGADLVATRSVEPAAAADEHSNN